MFHSLEGRVKKRNTMILFVQNALNISEQMLHSLEGRVKKRNTMILFVQNALNISGQRTIISFKIIHVIGSFLLLHMNCSDR